LLAYILWHRCADDVERDVYERAAEHFHRSLHRAPPAGFRGSALYRVAELSWLGGTGVNELSGAAGYEDWYLVDDFAALGVLNEAAVAHGHRTPHDEVARRLGAAAGGLYGLLEGRPDLNAEPQLIWVSRPPGAAKRALADLLGDGMDPAHSSLWRRALVLGPAPEYCLLAGEPPAGVAPGRLPQGWRATITTREEICNG
jgi:hypothetical protein